MADRPTRRASLRSGSRKRARSHEAADQHATRKQQSSKQFAECPEASAAVAVEYRGCSDEQLAPETADAVERQHQSMLAAADEHKPRNTRRHAASRQRQGDSTATGLAATAEDREQKLQLEQEAAQQTLHDRRHSTRSSRRLTRASHHVALASIVAGVDQAAETAAIDEDNQLDTEANAAPKAPNCKLPRRHSNNSNGKSSSSRSLGPTRTAEQKLWQEGYKLVAGVDEAGRGPLAGPVVAAACILPQDIDLPGLNDSKQMTEHERDRLYDVLTSHPNITYAVSVVDHEMIDEINILQAAMLAMQQAAEGLDPQPDHLLIDGNRRPKGLREDLPAQLLVKGDATSTCIAAASVIAKVTRDRLMVELDKQYPLYGFAQHKGYGVPAHRAAILQHGPCAVHRRSFEPVKSMVGFAGYGQKAAAAAAAALKEAATSEEAAAAAAAVDDKAEAQFVQRIAAGAIAVFQEATAMASVAVTTAEAPVAATAVVAAAATVKAAKGVVGSTAACVSSQSVLTEVQASSASDKQLQQSKARGATAKKGRIVPEATPLIPITNQTGDKTVQFMPT